ncbi:DUF881 domain-containing protein [Nocardioides coralli]|uniref:DUF881 domain-containing protein n=1 Tax=Nocardioides coralli TaxID=2872154 RepID=UPI001CA3EAF1|nr:DUF881 domain-containing protein [Nocardioides coralli]QZY27720.1 DUF881 domain-containing protein [Nocardioides coralli]
MAETRQRELPAHVTTPLLSLITEQALEEDYRVAAQRRAAEGAPAEPPRSRMVAGAAVVVFGVLIGLAAVQTSRSEQITDAGRATLIARIETERGALEDLRARIADLGRENRALTEGVTELTASRQQAEAQVRRLELSTGYRTASGEGVRVQVSGNPNGDPVQQVTDADLAKLVNGLWEAGAEAIAINDQRLNPLGPIRNVGRAVHVNTMPLTPPYLVRAIGDSSNLQARLLDTSHGAEFFSLAEQLGFEYTMDNVDDMTLPGALQRRLSYVEAGTADQRGRAGVEEEQQ